MGLDIGRPYRTTSATVQNVTDAAKGGRVLRVLCDGDVTGALIADGTGTIASIGGEGSQDIGIPYIGQLTVTKGAGGAAITVVWA